MALERNHPAFVRLVVAYQRPLEDSLQVGNRPVAFLAEALEGSPLVASVLVAFADIRPAFGPVADNTFVEDSLVVGNPEAFPAEAFDMDHTLERNPVAFGLVEIHLEAFLVVA